MLIYPRNDPRICTLQYEEYRCFGRGVGGSICFEKLVFIQKGASMILEAPFCLIEA